MLVVNLKPKSRSGAEDGAEVRTRMDAGPRDKTKAASSPRTPPSSAPPPPTRAPPLVEPSGLPQGVAPPRQERP